MNDCVFIDKAEFNRNMHRSYGWCEVGTPCKIKVETRRPNVSILGAISKDGLITLSRLLKYKYMRPYSRNTFCIKDYTTNDITVAKYSATDVPP
jgi:hypothetical protein